MIRQTLVALAAGASAGAGVHGQATPAAAAHVIERADTNNDGVVHRSEFIAARAENFDRIDRNGDGVFTAGELPSRPRARRLAEMIMRMDADGDGRVTRHEFTNAPTVGFDMADANGDDVVTAAELDMARDALEARQR